MKQAISLAWKYQFLTYPNPAVGAVVVRDGIVLSCEAHKQSGTPHAEVLALKSAYLKEYPTSLLGELSSSFEIHNFLYENHNDFFKDCEIFVTLEPCNHVGKTPACSNLLCKVGIKKVFIGSLDLNLEASGGIETLRANNIEVEVGIEKELCNNLLLPFTKWQKGNFRFFKLATREDGSCDGGYITSQDSLSLVHEIRARLELLIIGGNTVRTDRPTLDSRFSKSKKACDVLIYSNKTEFDRTIPLFDIQSREVFISNKFEEKEKKFIMIEGGFTLLDNVKNDIDMLMLFVSHKEKVINPFDIRTLGFKKIHSYYINGTDEVVFLLRH